MSPRRIPTKGELLRLQKLYRTDQRIADVLGGEVTEQLVAYWRRKKGVARYSFPKFSEREIQEVWDRFGDDFHAGMELGISKAAFYNWRRRYKITQRPEALKLEQLSLELFTSGPGQRSLSSGQQTIAQKILSAQSGQKKIMAGDTIEVEPEMVFSSRDVNEIYQLFGEAEVAYVWNPNRIILSLDGAVVSNRQELGACHKTIRDFARLQQIKGFFDVGAGDGLQIALEDGLVLPGQLILGTDKNMSAYGCLGSLAFTISPKEMADIWVQGRIRLTVPETIRVNMTGRPPRGVFVRDIAHLVAGQLPKDELFDSVIEFYGTAIDQMSVSERFTLCCITAAAGARSAVCPFDATTRRYIIPRARRQFATVLSDRNAIYKAQYTFDINTMKPVARSQNRRKAIPIEELIGVPIQKVFLCGAANGRFDDMRVVAEIVKGKQISSEVRAVIQPASRAVYMEALKKGLLRVFAEAGVVVLYPGNSSSNEWWLQLAPGEKALTTLNDNEELSGKEEIYQVSPAVAAASAITGMVTNPTTYVKI